MKTSRARSMPGRIVVQAASAAGMFSKIRSSGLGMVGRLLLGLAGAFLGGMMVRVAQIDYDWGVVGIGYEEPLFSLLGAVFIVALSRIIQFNMKKRKSKRRLFLAKLSMDRKIDA